MRLMIRHMMIAALFVGASGAAAAQAQSSRGAVDQIGSPQPVGMQQVSGRAATSASPALQLTSERGSGPASPQLTKDARSAQPSQPLSEPRDGRTSAVERVAGSDRCDPAKTDRPRAACAQVIETRAAEFARKDPTPLSPEQRIIVEQQARERSGSFAEAARRLATNGDDTRSMDAQGLASVVLSAPPAELKRDKPDADPAETEQLNAIINAIVTQTTPQ